MHDPEPEAPKGNAAINLINVTCAFPAGTSQNICYEMSHLILPLLPLFVKYQPVNLENKWFTLRKL